MITESNEVKNEKTVSGLLERGVIKPAGEWISVDKELPAIGQKVILFGNGVVQEEIYTMDAGDVSDYAPLEYFWTRDDLEDGIEVVKGQHWMALPEPPEAL